MAYIGNIPVPDSTEHRQEFTATASQTTFTTSGYANGFVDVYLNGVKLAAADFTANDNSTVVLTSGASAGDILAVVARTQTTDGSAGFASTSEVQGTHTTFSGSHSDTATTINLASVSGITSGDYVVGEGITPGTTVSSVGASSVVISAGLDTDNVGIGGGEPISFYKSNKVLSPGLVAGGLCRAWVNFDGDPVAIRASYNVASITEVGQGDYLVNFLTAMPDANYSTVRSVVLGGNVLVPRGGNTSSSYCNIYVTNTSNSTVDPEELHVAIFR